MEEEVKEEKQQQDPQAPQEPKKRSVVISSKVRILFESKSGSKDIEAVLSNRDVWSVTDVIGKKLESIKDKDDMDDTVVSVHSLEDEAKSDPPSDGEPRWEGEYLVGGAVVEKMSIPDAMKELAKAVISPQAALKGVERLAEQYFLRSRLDGFVFIGTFDGQPVVVPLISSFKDQKSECFAMLYRQMHLNAENLKAWVEKNFPEIAARTNWTGQTRRSGIVGPDGKPAQVLKFDGGCGKSGKSCIRK